MKATLAVAAGFGAVFAVAARPAHAQPVEGTFAINGDTINYEVSGAGPAMLLIHGFPLSKDLFEKQRAYFSHAYTVITPSLPGFGKSTTSTSNQTEANYAAEMIGLLSYLHVTSAVIGGHSMGGQVVLEMYQQQPSLFTGMILFDTNPAVANLIEKAEWPGYGRMAHAMGSASIAPSVAAVMVTGDAVARNPQLQTEIESFVDMAKPAGVSGGANALVTRPDYTQMLGQISVPTLVIVGQDDPVYPVAISKALAYAIPYASLAIIPGVAHASMFDDAEATDKRIEAFLSP